MKRWFFIITVAAIVLNLLDVMTLSDDLLYRFIWQADESDDPQLLCSWSDLFTSQWVHYQYQNGRAVVHTIGQFMLCMVPQWLFQVINGLLFGLLVFLCVKTSGQKRQHWPYLIVVTCLLLFVVMRGVRTTLFWSIGTVNYLYVTVATLAFFIFLRHLFTSQFFSSHSSLLIVLLSIIAFFVGWGHEAFSVPVSAAIVVFLFINRKQFHNNLVSSLLYPLLFYLFGTFFCLASPGIWGRAANGVTLSSRMLSGALNMVFNIRVFWLLLILLFILWRHDVQRFKNVIRSERYLFVALATALFVVLACGTTLERVAFYLDFMSILLILRHFTPALRVETIIKRVGTVVLLLFFVGALIVRMDNARRFALIERQMESPGQELIAVPFDSMFKGINNTNYLFTFFSEKYVNPSAQFGFYCSYMGFDSNDINMRCAAKLYGKQRMVFLPQDVVELMTTDSTAYLQCHPDANHCLYVWQMKCQHPVSHLIFELNDEDLSSLLPHQRLVAYHGDTYELDSFNYEVITFNDRTYLVFTKPTTNIYRRIKRVRVS